jgi:hypothetical protein
MIMPDKELDDRVIRQVGEAIDLEETRQPNRHMVHIIRVEPFMGRPYPQHQPHYE